MKVLSIIENTYESHGGPASVLLNQIEVINKKKKIIDTLQLNSISFFFLVKCFLFSSFRVRIYNFLKKYDLIHFHQTWSIKNFFWVYFLNKLLIKFFFVGHGYLDTWSIRNRYLKKKSFIIFFLQGAYNSAFASFYSTYEEYLESLKNIKSHNVFIIPNGISLDKYLKRELIKKTKKKILFFGRVHPKKGLDLMIKTINDLPEDFFDEFSFEVTGPSEKKYLQKIKAMIKSLGLEQKININGPVYGNYKYKHLIKNDIFILPSFEEGDSIALKEALAAHLPVIISKQCRLGAVKEYNAGFIIDTNKKSLYENLIKLKTSDIVCMGNQARLLIEDKYNNEICSNRLLKIYQDIYNNSLESNDWIENYEK